MGVKGFQTFVESYQDVFRWVDIVQMAADHRRIHPNTDPVIVVDGNNCLHFWVKQVDWLCGGQWDEYLNILGDFLKAFSDVGVQLVFFFDGLTPLDKREEWLCRRRQNIDRFRKIFDHVKASKPLTEDMVTVPAALIYAIPIALKYVFGATVYCNVDGECDRTIASYAVNNHCMAILAQDTDYIIYPTVPYISIEHLSPNSLQTRMYCREELCRELGIDQGMLPLFACLVGTDYVSRENLAGFHRRICFNRSIPGLKRIHTVVRCVADYVARLPAASQADLPRQLSGIYANLGLQNISFNDFKKGLDVYSLEFTGSSGYIYPGTQVTQQRDARNDESVYDVMLRKVKNGELCPTILNVICSGREIRTPSLEDMSNAEYTLPQCVLVYRPLRQSMYGLMFELKDEYIAKNMYVPHTGAYLPTSNTVEEWWVNPSGNDNIGRAIVSPVPVHLNGGISNADVMRNLIFQTDNSYDNTKWTVFLACLRLSMSNATFQHIPHKYKTLCAVLNYLNNQPGVILKIWEVEAFLIQAVHPQFSDKNFHTQLQLSPYNSRAIHLATLFLRGAEALFDLLWFCGNPIEIKFGMPWYFFNGRFFHYIYKCMSRGDNVEVELNGNSLNMFHQLRDATFEGLNI